MSTTTDDYAHHLSTRARTNVNTPAFVFDETVIVKSVKALRTALRDRPARILFAIKACSAEPVMQATRSVVDGFAAASPMEAEIASRFLGNSGELHITTPGFKREWFEQVPGATHVAFNSISQWERLLSSVPSSVSAGIRVNPGCSVVQDNRYDPGRRHSKLGIPITDVARLPSGATSSLRGVHVHNACLCQSFTPLLETVVKITSCLGPTLAEMDWINLGGGYIWDKTTDFAPLREAVDLLTTKYGLQVFLEPGAGIVNSAGYLVASVIDLLMSDGKMIAVLDTTVNHLPEVFEYQYEPDVEEHVDDGQYEYILAGCSCLAGDLFGAYSFTEPLTIGSRVTFANVGAYSLVKAHMFNGIKLPNIYSIRESGELVLEKNVMYEEYGSRCGGDARALV